jgi:hypothetical protein
MEQPPKVFISHADEDKAFARNFAVQRNTAARALTSRRSCVIVLS